MHYLPALSLRNVSGIHKNPVQLEVVHNSLHVNSFWAFFSFQCSGVWIQINANVAHQ